MMIHLGDLPNQMTMMVKLARRRPAAVYTGRRAAKGKRKLIYSDDESDSDISLDDPLRKKATTKRNSEAKNDRADESTSDLVLRELQRSNDLLSALVKRVEKSEKRLNLVEDKLESAGSSSGDLTPKTTKKKDVPIEVRVSKVQFRGLLLQRKVMLV